jgi:hypothetical protein
LREYSKILLPAIIHKKRIQYTKKGFSIDNLWDPKKKKYFPGRRRIMNSSTKCKHRPVHEIENRLYPDYDDGMFQRM